MTISNLTKERVSIEPSAIFYHLLEYEWFIDFGNFNILAAGTSKLNLLINESLLIKCDKSA